jgi:hypothetical protein
MRVWARIHKNESNPAPIDFVEAAVAGARISGVLVTVTY